MAEAYPLPAFHFRVRLMGTQGNTDTSFQEVTGIGAELDTEEVIEGGENRYVLQLPTRVKHPKLVLKRAIALASSPLVGWCKAVLEGDFSALIVPRLVMVSLLDQFHSPIRMWSFENAYPVNWEVEGFHATKNEVAIEKIELSYTYATRTL